MLSRLWKRARNSAFSRFTTRALLRDAWRGDGTPETINHLPFSKRKTALPTMIPVSPSGLKASAALPRRIRETARIFDYRKFNFEAVDITIDIALERYGAFFHQMGEMHYEAKVEEIERLFRQLQSRRSELIEGNPDDIIPAP